jgi:hypothetical protein
MKQRIQSLDDFINESKELDALNESDNESIVTMLAILQSSIAIGFVLGKALDISFRDDYGRTVFQRIGDWWKKRKKDKVVDKIIDRLKYDEEVQAFLMLPQSQQAGKWYKLLEPKLDDNEKQYLNNIYKNAVKNELPKD